MTRANGLNSVPTTLVYVDAQTGTDTAGNGSAMNPFATIAHAYSTISDNSSSKIYSLILSGNFSPASLVLKPFIILQGISELQTNIYVTGGGNNITLDSSWSSTSNAISGINNIDFNFFVGTLTNIDFDFTALSSESGALIYFNNCYIGAVTIIGTTTEAVIVSNCQFFGDVSATDMSYVSYYSVYNGTTTINASTTSGNSAEWESFGDIIGSEIDINVNNSVGTAHFEMQSCGCSGVDVNLGGTHPANTDFEFDWTSYPGIINYSSGATQASNVRFTGVDNSLFQLAIPQVLTTGADTSHNATNGFGSSITFGSAIQNNQNYDLLVNITFIITAATTASIALGVGPSSTPSTNTAIASFSTTGLATISAVVPAQYYLLVTKTGTLTSTNSMVVTPL